MSTATAPTLLITGATGTIGSALSTLLSARGFSFRVMVRSIDQVNGLDKLPGATIVEGDFNNAASLDAALQGIDKAFLLTNSSQLAESQQKRFVEAAKAAGVSHLVKLSQWAASASSPVRFLRYHAAVEQHIIESGIPYTFLRPNLFMQGLIALKDYIATRGIFFAAVGDATISTVDIRDIAEVAAAVLTGIGHENKIYHLTGPEAITHYQMADYLSAALHKTVHFVDTSDEIMHSSLLKAAFPRWQADGLIEDYAHYRNNEATAVTQDVQQVTGHAPRSFQQFAMDYASLFTKSQDQITSNLQTH
jgi:uncharacterized protein YbjT (DUF2867 family)